FLRELALERVALLGLGARAIGRGLARKVGRRRLLGRGLLRRHDVHLARHDFALLARGFALVAGVERAAPIIDARPDLALGSRGPRDEEAQGEEKRCTNMWHGRPDA